MKSEFVPYKLAVKLEELGFDEPCFASYIDCKLTTLLDSVLWGDVKGDIIAPTYSQAFRWFREKYNLQSCLKLNYDILDSYILYINGKEINRFTIKNVKWESLEKTESFKKSKCYKTYIYEEAELACLEKLIEIIENK
jgi:hypothetical protein